MPAPPIAVPAPTPQGVDQVPTRPAYGLQTVPTASAPVPAGAPAPVVLPAQTTSTAPYGALPAYQGSYIPYGTPDEDRKKETLGSTYIPMDSWIYPEMTRLYSLGFGDTMFLSMRPWTRQSVVHILEETEDDIINSSSEEAQGILAAVQHELRLETPAVGTNGRGAIYGTESAYTRLMGISGQTLRDSYHLGQTLVNDYGRPYEPGFNALLGASSVNEWGRYSLYLRGEYQHSPSGPGYSQSLATYLSYVTDGIPYSGFNVPQATIPTPVVAAANPFRIVEATLSVHLLGHEISGGKSDAWMGPAQGGAMAWSNNAENIYSFRINRVEPLHIPYLSGLLGPVRYDFFLGSLKGHTDPQGAWTHSTMFSFEPTKNFQFAFQRTVVFGGRGHEPVTLRTFFKSFFSISDTTNEEKMGRLDPGARFSDFSATYRLPFVRRYATFYADSIVHDDVTPLSAPRRASFRTGIYVSQIPMLRKLDFRVEAFDMDPRSSRSTGGTFNYYETIHRQAYTNKGFIMGDWAGREAKGGQAWLTYHLSGKEWVQLEYMNKKNDKDFIPGAFSTALGTYARFGGTTQNSVKASVVKRFYHDDVEMNAWVQYERWKAPAYMAGPQNDTAAALQITYFPKLKSTQSK